MGEIVLLDEEIDPVFQKIAKHFGCKFNGGNSITQELELPDDWKKDDIYFVDSYNRVRAKYIQKLFGSSFSLLQRFSVREKTTIVEYFCIDGKSIESVFIESDKKIDNYLDLLKEYLPLYNGDLFNDVVAYWY